MTTLGTGLWRKTPRSLRTRNFRHGRMTVRSRHANRPQNCSAAVHAQLCSGMSRDVQGFRSGCHER
jgi:hypothetical protein